MSDPVEVAAEAFWNAWPVWAELTGEMAARLPDEVDQASQIRCFRAAILAFLKACESEAATTKLAKAIERKSPIDRSIADQAEVNQYEDLCRVEARAVLRALADLAGGGT